MPWLIKIKKNNYLDGEGQLHLIMEGSVEGIIGRDRPRYEYIRQIMEETGYRNYVE